MLDSAGSLQITRTLELLMTTMTMASMALERAAEDQPNRLNLNLHLCPVKKEPI